MVTPSGCRRRPSRASNVTRPTTKIVPGVTDNYLPLHFIDLGYVCDLIMSWPDHVWWTARACGSDFDLWGMWMSSISCVQITWLHYLAQVLSSKVGKCGYGLVIIYVKYKVIEIHLQLCFQPFVLEYSIPYFFCSYRSS
jgi:hypothetical protein